MAAIERGLVNSRWGDGPEDIRPKFGGGDVSSEPKSPPPTKLIWYFSEWLLLNNDSEKISIYILNF